MRITKYQESQDTKNMVSYKTCNLQIKKGISVIKKCKRWVIGKKVCPF